MSYGKETSYGRLFKVEEFGAVAGDREDDSSAIAWAISEASAYADTNPGKRAVVEFAANKTYHVKQGVMSSNVQASILLDGISNVTLKGNNTTLEGDPQFRYLSVEKCHNVTIEGFNFDYDRPSACNATVLSRDGRTVLFEVPSWYSECVEKTESKPHWFAIPNYLDTRNHCWISGMEKVSDTQVRITFTTYNSSLWVGAQAFLPTPGYSHNGPAFFVGGNGDGVEFKNINIYSAAEFVFQINGNGTNAYETMKFTNVKMVAKHCETIAWRDVIHAKENRLKLVFDGCEFKGTHDDIFNISSTSLKITDYKDDVYYLYGEDYGGGYPTFYVGDTIQVIDTLETATITEIVYHVGGDIRVKLDKSLPVNARFFIDQMAAPAEIKNCTFNGSFRIRASGSTITNCKFKVLFMRTGHEGDIEGPYSKDITYKNCTFESAAGWDGTQHASFWGTVKNIRFIGCKIPHGFIQEADGVTIS